MKMLFLDRHKNSPCVCACAYKSGGGAKVFIYWRFAHLFRSRAVTHLNHRGMFIHKANELRTERHTSRWIKPPHSDRPNQSDCVGGMAGKYLIHMYIDKEQSRASKWARQARAGRKEACMNCALLSEWQHLIIVLVNQNEAKRWYARLSLYAETDTLQMTYVWANAMQTM